MMTLKKESIYCVLYMHARLHSPNLVNPCQPHDHKSLQLCNVHAMNAPGKEWEAKMYSVLVHAVFLSEESDSGKISTNHV